MDAGNCFQPKEPVSGPPEGREEISSAPFPRTVLTFAG